MRLLYILAVVFLNACGGQAPQLQQPVGEAAPENVARAIEGAVEQYRQAYQVRSPEALAQLYTHNLDVVLVFQGRIHQGWTQIEAFLRKRLQDATKVRMVITDLGIHAIGDNIAIANAGLESTIGDAAMTVTERGALTLVFRKVGEDWKVVAEHFSYRTGSS